jgi:hypothetical protein
LLRHGWTTDVPALAVLAVAPTASIQRQQRHSWEEARAVESLAVSRLTIV